MLDLGPVQVNKTQDKWIGWPTYAGAIVTVAGVILLLMEKQKNS